MQIEPMGEPVNIDIDAAGNELPPKHDKKIIIDADTMIFSACAVCQYEVEIVEDLDDEELDAYRLKHAWDEDTKTYLDINLNEAFTHAREKLDLILDRIGGKHENVELHFTGGRRSFRYQLLKDHFPDDETMHYKFKRRKKAAPAGLLQVKEMFTAKYEGDIHYEYEADEVVVLRKKQLGDDAILVAVDKDVLRNTPGTHWNYYDSQLHKIPMKWETYTEEEAIFNQHLQVITGDKSDNVPGLKGIGEKKALKFIRPGMTSNELIKGVLRAYMSHCNYGDPVIMAQLNMQLVNMHQLQEDMTIKLWSYMEVEDMATAEEIEAQIEQRGTDYTASMWKQLKARDKTLTPEEADLYYIIQKAHLRLTGHSLPPIKGARMTRAQKRDDLGPEVKDEVLDKAVAGGLAARLAKMRKDK